MREYLFRGKRKDNGEWVEGYLYITHNGVYEIGCYNIHMNIERWTFEVDPSTVGQYTDMTDKNGKRIFEGDVVQFTEWQLGGKEVPVAEAVEFSEGGFATHRYFLNNWLRNAAKGNCQLQDIEIIGNIHDNPEMVEEVV